MPLSFSLTKTNREEVDSLNSDYMVRHCAPPGGKKMVSCEH